MRQLFKTNLMDFHNPAFIQISTYQSDIIIGRGLCWLLVQGLPYMARGSLVVTGEVEVEMSPQQEDQVLQ